MWQREFTWFFALFHHEFRQGNRMAFEVLMALAFAHLFGFYNPKQLADFLDIPHQKLYVERVAKWRLNEMPEGVAQGPKAELDLPPQDAFWYLWFHETNHKTRRMP